MLQSDAGWLYLVVLISHDSRIQVASVFSYKKYIIVPKIHLKKENGARIYEIFLRSSLKMVYIFSAHIPLSKTQTQKFGPNLNSERLRDLVF